MWIGIALLVLILAASIWLWWGLGGIFREMGSALDGAAQAAMATDWATADAYTAEAATLWKTYRTAAASFTDHEPLEQIDALFRELELYRQQSLPGQYAVVCIHLSRLAEAVEEALSLKWWSLL